MIKLNSDLRLLGGLSSLTFELFKGQLCFVFIIWHLLYARCYSKCSMYTDLFPTISL